VNSARGVFITFEGGEGSGKSTQIGLLASALEAAGLMVVALREPGGTPVGEAVRAALLDPGHAGMSPRAELLLYEASRAELTERRIRPSLAAGEVVLCDRFYDSTTAYQGYGRGLPLEDVIELNEIGAGGLEPDLTIVLDIDPSLGLSRATAGGADRLEAEEAVFHERVREGFLRIADSEPDRVVVVDATGEPAEVAARVLGAVCDRIPVLAAALGYHLS
jgi:dTMP kinase